MSYEKENQTTHTFGEGLIELKPFKATTQLEAPAVQFFHNKVNETLCNWRNELYRKVEIAILEKIGMALDPPVNGVDLSIEKLKDLDIVVFRDFYTNDQNSLYTELFWAERNGERLTENLVVQHSYRHKGNADISIESYFR